MRVMVIPEDPTLDQHVLSTARFVTEALGERSFRAGQLFRWIHQRGATSFEEMTDLSKSLREKLMARAEIVPLVKDLEQRSVDGTIKYRWKTRDGRYIDDARQPQVEHRGPPGGLPQAPVKWDEGGPS